MRSQMPHCDILYHDYVGLIDVAMKPEPHKT